MRVRAFILMSLYVAVAGVLSAGAATFSSSRIATLASYAGLQHTDTLQPGVCHSYSYRNRPLTIRVNRWSEIEHIGLLLFPEEQRRMAPLPIYDFLERRLLAALCVPADSDYGMNISFDKVHFSVGNARTALTIDTTAAFTESHVDLRVYRVSWAVGGKKVLEMSFPMDYQLFTGLNAVELEQSMLKNLRRYVPQPWPYDASGFPEKGKDYTSVGSCFISPLVRNDIYYKRETAVGRWYPVSGRGMSTRALSNMLLLPDSDNTPDVMIRTGRYGLRKDSVTVKYSAWWQLCVAEGCTPYFGLKRSENGLYHGTVFMVNRLGGYLHLMSIEMPEQALDSPCRHTARSRMYCYIPLYNVSDDVLNTTDFEPIK